MSRSRPNWVPYQKRSMTCGPRSTGRSQKSRLATSTWLWLLVHLLVLSQMLLMLLMLLVPMVLEEVLLLLKLLYMLVLLLVHLLVLSQM